MALKRLGFTDKATLFCELHRWGFEQLTMEMTGTSDVSQHRPIFRHPSGHFGPGTSSQIEMIEIPPIVDEYFGNSPPSIPIPIASTSKRRRSVRPRQNDDPFVSYREPQPVSESAVSSPMIRSPGLSSSTLSDSTRSFSPFSPPPAQFPSPRLEAHPWWTPLGLNMEAPVEKEEDVETTAINSLAGLYFESSHHTDPTMSTISNYSPRHSLIIHPDHRLPPCCQQFENGEASHTAPAASCNFPAPLPMTHSRSPSSGPSSNVPSATTTPTVSRKTKKLKSSIRPNSSHQPPHSNLNRSRSQATSALEFISPTAYDSLASPSTSHSRPSHLSRSSSIFHPYSYPQPYPQPYVLGSAASSSRQYPQRPAQEVYLGRSQSSVQRSNISIRQAARARDLENAYPSPSSTVPSQDTRPFYSRLFGEFSLSSFFPQTQRPESFVRNSPPPPPPTSLQASPLLAQFPDSSMV
ncbi:hypothetical protein JCM5350_003849 [Sporobolomyces pararoseus]